MENTYIIYALSFGLFCNSPENITHKLHEDKQEPKFGRGSSGVGEGQVGIPYKTSIVMDKRQTIENKIKDLRIHRIKAVNSIQKITEKHISEKEFLERIDCKMRLLNDLDRDIKQSEEQLKELSKSKL